MRAKAARLQALGMYQVHSLQCIRGRGRARNRAGLRLNSLTSLASRRPESRTRTRTIMSTRMRSARFTLAQGEAK